MRCLAIIEAAEHPSLDTAIVWDNGERMVGIAYLDGQVTATRALEPADVRGAITEVCDAYQIREAKVLPMPARVAREHVRTRSRF